MIAPLKDDGQIASIDNAIETSEKYQEVLQEQKINDRLPTFMEEQIIDRPPPAYTLTSPCLPPADTKHQPWPPEPPPAFDRLPPYPAGPRLIKTEYPKSTPGPTYACPYCEGRFLYHRPFGLVECPFCHEAISIGHYIRIRALSQTFVGIFAVLTSITLAAVILTLFPQSSRIYLCAVGAVALFGLILTIRAAYLQSKYRETERIEF